MDASRTIISGGSQGGGITLAVAALGMHLLHGVWAAGMTLGLNTSIAAAERLRIAAVLVAAVVVVGFLLPPFAILFGLIP